MLNGFSTLFPRLSNVTQHSSPKLPVSFGSGKLGLSAYGAYPKIMRRQLYG
jgi:hypothetical protein